jgi:hypothetical protein
MSIILQISNDITNEDITSACDKIKTYNPGQEIYSIIDNKNHIFIETKLREWWKNNRNLIHDDIIYLMEYSNVIYDKLPELSKDLDLAGRNLYTENTSMRHSRKMLREADPNWTPDNWMWWYQVDKGLSDLLGNRPALGMPSNGFYVTRSWVLDCIADEKYNNIYTQSMIKELRLPTLASLCGAKLGTIELDDKVFHSMRTIRKPSAQGGVGTELSKILESIGIKSSPNCSCKKRAATMDQNGIEWCENNKETIIGWLEEEAKKRKMLFSKTIAGIVLNRAIKAAKKKRSDNSLTT